MEKFLKLKTDPQLFHHYMIGVACKPMNSGNPGEMFLKYGPLHFTNDDIENVQNAALLSVDEIFETSSEDAAKIHDCQDLIGNVAAMKMSAAANNATLHHFSCEFEIGEDWFEGFVKMANTSKETKKLLMDAKV